MRCDTGWNSAWRGPWQAFQCSVGCCIRSRRDEQGFLGRGLGSALRCRIPVLRLTVESETSDRRDTRGGVTVQVPPTCAGPAVAFFFFGNGPAVANYSRMLPSVVYGHVHTFPFSFSLLIN